MHKVKFYSQFYLNFNFLIKYILLQIIVRIRSFLYWKQFIFHIFSVRFYLKIFLLNKEPLCDSPVFAVMHFAIRFFQKCTSMCIWNSSTIARCVWNGSRTWREHVDGHVKSIQNGEQVEKRRGETWSDVLHRILHPFELLSRTVLRDNLFFLLFILSKKVTMAILLIFDTTFSNKI